MENVKFDKCDIVWHGRNESNEWQLTIKSKNRGAMGDTKKDGFKQSVKDIKLVES